MIDFQAFKTKFPEFENLDGMIFERILEEIRCLFPQYFNGWSCQDEALVSYLIAHLIVVRGLAVSIGIAQPSGIVASSSVGSVSVSMVQKPFSNSLEYFLGSTPYGEMYLAMLNTRSGLCYVN